MSDFKSFRNKLYNINNESFGDLVFEAFNFQVKNNKIYQEYVNSLGIKVSNINSIKDIPFLPIQFFKSHEIKSGDWLHDTVFESSGTTSSQPSRHFVDNLAFYQTHTLKNFKYFYGDPAQYHFMALLPSYLERSGSSLVFMVQQLMESSGSGEGGYYLYNYDELIAKIKKVITSEGPERKIMVIGITFALLELVERETLSLGDKVIVMETGGMKGRRKELIRTELHEILTATLNINAVHAEYGMTELLSQAYSYNKGKFLTPPWMKVMVREINDPFSYTTGVGGINIIDLANIHSCAFIETQDVGKVDSDGAFEVLGRFDNSDIRGCNLLYG